MDECNIVDEKEESNFIDEKFEDKLTTTIMRLFRAHFNITDECLKEEGLHHGQPYIIISLYHNDGQNLKELTKCRNVKASTTTNMVSRMEKLGLVKKIADEKDRRKIRVFLTDKGREKYNSIIKINDELEKICFRGFSDEEKLLTKILLKKIIENIKAN